MNGCMSSFIFSNGISVIRSGKTVLEATGMIMRLMSVDAKRV
jgi:hypothetical protein